MNLLYNIKYFFTNLFYWGEILWNDRNWDYVYLLEIEKHKLNSLIKGIKHAPENIKWIKVSIKLIDIILEKDSCLEYLQTINNQPKWKLIKYVNIKNSNRFLSISIENKSIVYKNMLRQYKAMYLYNKIRYNYMWEWWD